MPEDELSDEDGTALVGAARAAVEGLLSGRRKAPDGGLESRFSFEAGVFVTISAEGSLRGCIGFPMPTMKLYRALSEAAEAAATRDPRFPAVRWDQLDGVTFEVTVLSKPRKVEVSDPEQYPSKIKVGRNGLIVRRGSNSGLLLPQVPVEYGWSEREFLGHTCEKAGLPRDCWTRKNTEVLTFEGTVFGESEPGGSVARRELQIPP